jgi:hypothetical protein
MDKLYNIKYLNLSNRPETYRTILKDKYGKNSLSTSVRRKMASLIRYGFVLSKPMKRQELIFYTMQKKYFIVYTKKSIYYCDNINTLVDTVQLTNSYKLKDCNWIKYNDKEIDISEVIICF